MRQLGAQQSADGVQSAGEQMDLTAEAIRQDLGKQAVAGSQLSEQKLAAAQQQLQRDMFQVEHGLLRQQLDRLKEQLVAMLHQQQEILKRKKEEQEKRDAAEKVDVEIEVRSVDF